jgi:hypothetical protein
MCAYARESFLDDGRRLGGFFQCGSVVIYVLT